MSIAIRRATRADQPLIRQIVRRARINPLGLDWRRFLVADECGHVVGIGQVKPHWDGSRELASIATIPARQGQGVASRVIAALLAQERGDVYLVCRSALEPFYRRFGFRSARSADLPPLFRLLYPATRFWGGRIMKRKRP